MVEDRSRHLTGGYDGVNGRVILKTGDPLEGGPQLGLVLGHFNGSVRVKARQRSNYIL